MKRSQLRRRKPAIIRRRPLFEELEKRRMLATDFGQIASALNAQLQGMQTAVTASLNSYQSGAFSNLPFVGHSLGNAAQFVNRFNSQLQTALGSLGSVNSFTDSDIQNALATDPLLPFVVDRNGTGAGPDDVFVSHPGNLGATGFEVDLRLQAAITASSATVKFDTGLPALPMIVADGGTIDVSTGFAFDLAFTYNSTNQQVLLDSSKDLVGMAAPDANHPIPAPAHPLAIFVTAGLPAGFTANTYVGFIQGTATPLAGSPNSLYLTAMVSNLTTTANITLDGTSKLNVQYVGDFAQGAADFPAIDSYIHINWDFHSNNPAADRPVINYDNVYLQLGKFISKVVGPVFKAIQTTTKPMGPVQDILRKPLPGLSDLRHLIQPDKNITLLDLAGVLAQNTNYGPLFDLIKNVGDIVNSIDQIQIDDNVRLPLGGFDLNNYDLRGIGAAGDVHNLNLPNLTSFSIDDVQGLGQNINQVIDQLQTTDQAKDLTKKLVAELNNGYTIKFPILDDPRNAIFNLLMGKESDLFTLTVDEVVHAEGGQVPSLSVFGMGVEFGGAIDVDAHLQLSYDTLGIREILNDIASGNTSKIPDDVKDGYYVTPDSHFKLSGSLVAGVGVAIGIYSAKVGGFISTDNGGDDPVSITFDDPNKDGKVRLSEIAAGATHTSGRLLGELGIEVGIGVRVLGKFIGVKHRFDIASVVLVDLNMPGPNDPPIITGPVLASQPDAQGAIDLYIGAEAGMRQQVDQTDGNETIYINHIEPPSGSPPTDSETVEIWMLRHFDVLGTTHDYWVSQTISGVKSISGYADQGDLYIDVLPHVTSALHFEGGAGKATLNDSGSGPAYLKAGGQDSELVGGSGNNTLFGGPGNDTIALGSADNIVGGGAGDNTVIITTPMTQGGLLVGGYPGSNNTLAVLAGDNTTSISATPEANGSFFDLNYQIAGAIPAPGLALDQFSTVVISTQDRATNITVGDLSGAGVTQVFVNEPTAGTTGRTVDLDARAGSGPSDLSLLPFLHVYPDPKDAQHIITDNALLFANATTGMNTYLMGMSGADQTTIHQHGGTTLVGQLLTNDGSVTFDTSTRQAGQNEAVTFSTPPLDYGNIITTQGDSAGNFVVDAFNYPVLTFHGLATQDNAIMNVAPPNLPAGSNLILVDASTLVGGLVVNAQGGPSAVNQMTLLKEGSRAIVTLDGGATTTSVQFGASRLSEIRNSATVRNATLTIDDSASPTPDISMLTANAFRWTIPSLGSSPTLSLSGLRGPLTVLTGAGDEFDIEQTPPGISQLVFDNSQAGDQNAIYAVGASIPIVANGNFSLYLGWRLNLDGSITQVNHLTGLPVSITLNFSGSPAGDVGIDGDADPAGASYVIDGAGNLHVLNLTVGLDVTINGFRAQDQLHLHLPGGSVHANLTQTGPATITVDGAARSAGMNPTAVNDIAVDSRGGNVTLDPAGNDISVLHLFNTLYVVGSLPQDNLTLTVPTQTNVTNTVTTDASQLEGALHVNIANPLAQVFSPFGLTTIVLSAVNPLLAVFIVGTDPLPGNASYLVDQTTLNFGAGQLARIQGNVTVSKAVLNINDSTAAQPSNLSLTDTTFNNWVIPNTNLTPALHYSNLYRTLTVFAGATDRFELDRTPATIDAIVLNNATATQDEIYSTHWSVPITANGNWSIFLGSFMHSDGTVERIKQLVGLAIPVTLNFSGIQTGRVVLDGDSDPAGAQYTIDGNGNLHIVNQTVSLNVTINGYRDQDQVYIYLPGGTVAADLTQTGPGSFYLDGKSRLVGNHPTAPNAISATVRPGNVSLDPVDTFDSVLHAFNTMYVLGSMPQDSLSVVQQTAFKVAPRSQGESQTSMDMWDDVGPFSHYTAVNPPTGYFSVLSTPYFQTTGHDEPRFLTGTTVPQQIDYYDTDLVYQGPAHTALVHVRVFPLNFNPIATDNQVNLDASQVRGAFGYRAAEPDYALAEIFTADPNNNANYYGANIITTFGQTFVNLKKVNPELAVTITGTAPLSAAHYAKLSENQTLPNLAAVLHAAATQLDIGAGLLANIQGNVDVHNLWLHEVDDRQGTAANSLILTAATLTGWATASGATRPTLSFDTLQGDLLLTGGAADQFGVEDTPGSAFQTTIRNLASGGATPGVYLMGKTVMPLYVNGRFSVYAGRRLTSDGTVTAVGLVSNLSNTADRFAFTGGSLSTNYGTIALHNLQWLNSGRFYSDSFVLPDVPLFDYMVTGGSELALPVFFNYAGDGQGALVFDASSEVITSADNFGNQYIGLAANPNYPQQADLRFSKRVSNSTLFGDVIYGPNIELFDYGQRETNTFSSANKYGPTVIFDNPLNAPVHYVSNPNSDPNRWDEVVIGAAAGPVDVHGFDGLTRVKLDPKFSGQFSSFVGSGGTLPGWGSGARGANLLSTITADVTVGHAGLTIRPDTDGSAAPGNLPTMVLTDNQITGLAGAPIHFNNLANGYTSDLPSYSPFGQFPGLELQMPGYGLVSATVQNTPGNVTTEIDTGTTPIGAVTVLGTTGPLYLANPNYGLSYSAGTRPVFSFTAGSVTIGNGTVASIAGPISLGQDYHVTGDTTIDDRSDVTPRQVSFSTSTQGLIQYSISGLSSTPISIGTAIQSPHLTVYGPAHSQYTVLDAPLDTRIFAGLGSSVEFTDAVGQIYRPGVTVLGAQSVLVDPRYDPASGLNFDFFNDSHITISPDPARPADGTDLTINYAGAVSAGNMKLDAVGGGYDALFVNNTTPNISYKADTTHLTLLTNYPYAVNAYGLDVLDTGSAGTIINPGCISLNVKATVGPLEIRQGGAGIVTLGNSGSLQGIQGSVSFSAGDPNKPRLPMTIDDSADPASRTVSVSSDGAGNTIVGGLTTIPVTLTGNQFDVTLKGGTGNNRLIGPDVASAWNVSSAGGGALNRIIAFTGFATLQGGSANDSFFFKPGGSLASDLDGGGGSNTLYYQAGMLGGSEVIDLPNHHAPRISGMVLNIQASNAFPALAISNPGELSFGTYYLREPGGQVTPITVTSSGGFGTKSYGAVGLPPGVAVDPQSGTISGFNNDETYSRQATLSVTDDTGTVSTSVYWLTQPGIVLATPASQTSQVGSAVNLPIVTTLNNYGTALAYSYDSQYGAFPPGLSIDAHTGTISGTLAGDANLNSPYYIHILASDGIHTGNAYFNWTVLSGLSLTTPQSQTSVVGETANLSIVASNSYGTTLTYSVTGTLPPGLSIDSQTGVIDGTIAAGAYPGGPYSFRVLARDGVHAAATNFIYWTVKSFLVSSPGNRNIPEGVPVNFSLDTDLPIQNPAHTPLTFAVYFYGNSATDPAHDFIHYDSAAHAITGLLPDGWISTDGSPLILDVRVFDANTQESQDVYFNWNPVPGFSVSSFLGDRNNRVRDQVSVSAASISNPAGHSFTVTATGLPAGLSIDPGTGLISGTMTDTADAGSPYHVSVSVTDTAYGADSASASFQWIVLPGIIIPQPANQTSQLGDHVSLAIQATTVFGQPLTYSAQGLPPGLAINSQSGLINGTIASGDDAGSPYHVVISATDGMHTGSVALVWNVVPVDHSTLEAISWADPSLGSPLPNSASYLEAASTVVSADGRYVAFYSYASNLVPGDTNNNYDVFVRDRQTGTTTLVSGGVSGPGNGGAFDPSISADGRYVAFYSNSRNLVPGGTNGNYQVFVRDLQTGTTTLVSTGPNGPGNNGSGSPSISANGRYVAFYSSSNNLTPEEGNGFYQIFVRDLQTGTTTLVSTGSSGEGNGQSYYAPALSADGRYIAFVSYATNLAPGGANGISQIFVRDFQTGTTTIVSTGVGGAANRNCFDVAISADGSHVAFDSGASNLVAGAANFISNVYVTDWQSSTIGVVSVDSAGQLGNNGSYDPSISASGRYVAFDSYASNLVAGDTNGRDDVFLHDLQTGITKRISLGPATEGDNDSYYPSISADGRAVAFNSAADNLVSGFNVQNFGDIYLYYNPDNGDTADPLSVGNANDDGPGSLRQAIVNANQAAGTTQTITFALPSGPQTINLLTPLPATTDHVAIRLDGGQNVTVKGGLNGTGSLAVNAGSNLTGNFIVQGSLVIGGTAGAPAIVTIAASDASGNPLTAAASANTAPSAPTNSLSVAVATVANVASASVATVTFTTAVASGSSPIPGADAQPTQSSIASPSTEKQTPTDSESLIDRRSLFDILGESGLSSSANDGTRFKLLQFASGAFSPSDQLIAPLRQSVISSSGIGGLFDAAVVAALFGNANELDWTGATPASQCSESNTDLSLMADELLEAIGQQWRN